MPGKSRLHHVRCAQARGVTLIELMIVIVVVGILAAIAVPSYRNYMMRAQRGDAMAALLRIAAAQEKFYLHNNTYATEGQRAGAPPGGLGVAATESGFYTLAIAANPAFPADFTRGFIATATAAAGGPQIRDTDCRTFTIDQTGARNATNSSNNPNRDACWR